MDRPNHFLHIKEGVTQVNNVAVLAYGIGILPLICEIRDTNLQVMQPWYADNARSGGNFKAFQEHLRDMLVMGPIQGYLLEPTNIILIVYPWNFHREESHFRGCRFK